MRKLLTFLLPVAAIAAGCGADSKSCTGVAATLEQGPAPVERCSAPAGSSVAIRVRLCPHCGQTSPSCVTEFVNGAFEIDPQIRRCEEDLDAGCPFGQEACESDPTGVRTEVACSVTVPAGLANGTQIPVLAPTGQVSTVTVSPTRGCSFAKAAP